MDVRPNAPLPHPSASRRLVQLDVLRGLAIVLVLFRHPVIVSDGWGVSIWRPFAFRMQTFGWTGVDLFFVLSGFLVGGLLLHEIHNKGRLDVWRFLIRRGFKIWPSYFLLLAFVFVTLVFRQHHSTGRAFRELLPNLLHVQNYFGSVRGHTWSLSVEEHFYLALPVFLLLVIGWRGRSGKSLPAVPTTAAVLIVGCTALRLIHNGPTAADFHLHGLRAFLLPYPNPDDFNAYGGYTHLRIDGLFLGVLLAYLHHFHPAPLARIARRRMLLLMMGAALVAPMFFIDLTQYFVFTIGYTMLYLGYACILVACVYATPESGMLGRLLTSRPARGLAWVGLFSYPIYLWMHDLGWEPVMHHVVHHARAHLPVVLYWPVVNGCYFVMAIGGGAVMSMLVERPALAMREWLFPSRTSGALGHAPGVRETTPEPKDIEREVDAMARG